MLNYHTIRLPYRLNNVEPVHILPLPAFRDNYIWTLFQDYNPQTWVVDPGDADAVNGFLNKEQRSLNGILITHHHWDHTNGVAELASRWQCPVYGPAHLDHLITQAVKEGDTVSLFDHSFHVLETPAHTLDHLCYFCETLSHPLLFCGDILFRGGCGRIKEGTAEQMHSALERLSGLPDETRVYCTHEYTLSNYHFALSLEPHNGTLKKQWEWATLQRKQDRPTLPTRIQTEKLTNPFLRCHLPEIIANAANQLSEPPAQHSDQAFAQIRRAKNSFS